MIDPDCPAAAAVCAGEVVVHAGAESYLAEHPEDSPVGQIAGVACVLFRRGDLVAEQFDDADQVLFCPWPATSAG
ncbi:hypothetical protein [Rhodococcus opacus]|uniref:hypothetical protein n=1 Tax=Rhodococcus opacus TaxID=37919 RepID=UPI001305471F|nr:hypothetical protein [Rhodococcus opacus]